MLSLTFKQGLRDAVPIALGYISVAFAFGMIAVGKGLPIFVPTIISLTSFTGTGQFVGVDLISGLSSIIEIIFTLFIINARYFLMSLSLSQRLSNEVTFWQRLIIAFGNTDETYGVSMSKNEKLNFIYMLGLIVCSYSGWVFGTFLGSIAGGIIPISVIASMGIALYAMFLAIIIPPAKKSRSICLVIIIAVVLSCIFNFTPFLSKMGNGWIVIISGISAAIFGALLFPVSDKEGNT